MDFVISGDSHGPVMIGTLTGFPAGLKINIEKINEDLKRRQEGYGRGKRMKIENDKVEIVSGIWKSITTGAPISVLIENKGKNTEKEVRSIPRPGHGDYSAYMKYKLPDLNIYPERNSARWTVVLTALGNIAKQFLNLLNIEIKGYVESIGKIKLKNGILTEEAKEYIDNAKTNGDTLGGSVKIIVKNINPGIGGYSSIFERLDSQLGQIIMTIPSVKGLIIGNNDFSLSGREYHDEFYYEKEKNKIKRKSNNAGGIEAGFTNGENIEITVFLKPIPTLAKPLNSINLATGENTKSPYIRSDVTVIPASVVILENAVALVIAKSIINQFGNDNVEEIARRYNSANLSNWNDGFWQDHTW
ncbi:chorismate synthase [Marinitoga sp. 1138]|uniref:chorismate synthase n=1 Tax=Marinitoga sp. 1138 TaxID=1643334 RepID=UPI001585FD2A|nr:chorismate synthase [Marinitoga sp. 1138]NUU98010.1 chorismate synthase [Marinitoga sp. 1138]